MIAIFSIENFHSVNEIGNSTTIQENHRSLQISRKGRAKLLCGILYLPPFSGFTTVITQDFVLIFLDLPKPFSVKNLKQKPSRVSCGLTNFNFLDPSLSSNFSCKSRESLVSLVVDGSEASVNKSCGFTKSVRLLLQPIDFVDLSGGAKGNSMRFPAPRLRRDRCLRNEKRRD